MTPSPRRSTIPPKCKVPIQYPGQKFLSATPVGGKSYAEMLSGRPSTHHPLPPSTVEIKEVPAVVWHQGAWQDMCGDILDDAQASTAILCYVSIESKKPGIEIRLKVIMGDQGQNPKSAPDSARTATLYWSPGSTIRIKSDTSKYHLQSIACHSLGMTQVQDLAQSGNIDATGPAFLPMLEAGQRERTVLLRLNVNSVGVFSQVSMEASRKKPDRYGFTALPTLEEHLEYLTSGTQLGATPETDNARNLLGKLFNKGLSQTVSIAFLIPNVHGHMPADKFHNNEEWKDFQYIFSLDPRPSPMHRDLTHPIWRPREERVPRRAS